MATITNNKKVSTGKVCGNCLAQEGNNGKPKLSACARCGLEVYVLQQGLSAGSLEDQPQAALRNQI